jgi:TatA/E family protein of Tat protein translocase
MHLSGSTVVDMSANVFGPDLGYIVIIAVVVLLGGSQLPKIARNIGSAGKEFRKAQSEADEEAEREKAAKAAVPPPTAVGPVTPPAKEASLNLSQSELEALLKAREEQVRREVGDSAARGQTSN